MHPRTTRRLRLLRGLIGPAALLVCLAAPVRAQEPPADQPADWPNVLLIAVDDLNNDLGAYGHPLVRSPQIDRLAARGVRFDRAYCQYPVCNPSRSSLMTGLYPDQTGVHNNQRRFRETVPDVQTLPQWFRRHGYFAARVGKIFHYGVPLQIGTDGLDDSLSWDEVVNPRGIDRDSLHLVHTLEPGRYGGTLSWLSIPSRDEDHTDGIGARAALRLMEEHHPGRTGRPLFLAVGFYRPHTPYVAPDRYFDLYPRDRIEPLLEREGDRDDIPVAALADRPHQRALTIEQRREIIQAYYASISLMDAQVGLLLDGLDRLGLADNTIVVFVSDHGYHLGHHGLWQKGDLFEGSARVPLIIAAPGAPAAGRATGEVVELVDLYPTIAELAGLDLPGHLSGRSLVPVLNDPPAEAGGAALTQAWSRARGQHPDVPGRIMGYSVRTPRYRYTEWDGGRHGVELYDYEADPMEWTNRAGRPGMETVEDRLRDLLREKVRAADGAGRPEE